MAKIVLFIDALEPNEYGAGWTDTERGLVESGYPKVTPKVTSEVYTGETPSNNGMGAAHSLNGQQSNRPRIPTIQEKLEMAGYNVISLHMPYCLPLQLRNGAWISTAMGNQGAGQNPLAQLCAQPPSGGNLLDPQENKDAIYNSKKEDMFAKASSMLNAVNMGNFDVAFFAIRTPDEYTHFQWHEEYRERILQDLAQEISRWQVNHDVLWWSDHGSQEKKEVFRINKWLMEKGYLNLDIDLEFSERFEEEFQTMTPQQAQQGLDLENQLGIQSPGVEMRDDSVAVSMDPYDSCIDILDDDFNSNKLISDMMDTSMYKGVGNTEDIWGEGQFMDQCPDIVTLREDHVLITGNIHPEPIGMGFYRTGVHSAYGAWGITDENFKRAGDVKPIELHDIIWEFVTGESQIQQQVMNRVKQVEEMMKQTQQLNEEIANETIAD